MADPKRSTPRKNDPLELDLEATFAIENPPPESVARLTTRSADDFPLEGFDRRPTPPPRLLTDVPASVRNATSGSTARWPPAQRGDKAAREKRRRELSPAVAEWADRSREAEVESPESRLVETLRALTEGELEDVQTRQSETTAAPRRK
ncbi:MAG: hypothetical protein U0271_29765 [Polyangiaceae bacterium]